jgi:hypothetical protein
LGGFVVSGISLRRMNSEAKKPGSRKAGMKEKTGTIRLNGRDAERSLTRTSWFHGFRISSSLPHEIEFGSQEARNQESRNEGKNRGNPPSMAETRSDH